MRLFFGVLGFILVGWAVAMVASAHEPVPPGKTVLTWATDDTPIRRAQVELFNKLNPDLLLKIDPTNRDQNKVIVQSLGGVGPDVFDMSGTELAIFVNSGIALDVTAELRDIGVDPDRDVWEAAKALYRFNGRDYGVPLNLDTVALLYNKDHFDEAGVSYPSGNPTWEEVVDLAKTMTRRSADGQVERYGLLYWWNWRDFFALMGERVFSEDGKKVTVDSPAGLRAVRLMSDFAFKHRVAPTSAENSAMATVGGWGGGNEGRFVAGRASMVFGPRYFTAHFRRARNLRVGVAALPIASGGCNPVRGRVLGINARSPRRAAALRFLAYVAGPDYNRLNNDMADGVGGIARYTKEPGFLYNPRFPEEKSNLEWREAMLAARPDRTSPFVSNNAVDAAMQFQLDLVAQGRKTPEQALKDAKIEIEKRMMRNLRDHRTLRRQFEQGAGGP